MKTSKLTNWLKNQKKINKIEIKKKKINLLKDWIFNKNIIFHKSKNFFSIKPFLFQQKNKKKFQPLIVQKEHGILGIIKQKKKVKTTIFYNQRLNQVILMAYKFPLRSKLQKVIILENTVEKKHYF